MSQTETTLHDAHSEKKRFLKRVVFIEFWIVLLALLMFVRHYYLQVIDHYHYTHLSLQNQLTYAALPAGRGLIYDRNGVLLAENLPVSSLVIIPSRVPNLKETLATLNKILPISEDEIRVFFRLLKQHNKDEPVPIKLRLSEEEIARFSVNQFRLPGVSIQADLLRHYLFPDLFAHVLGYVGRINVKELSKIDTLDYRGTNFIGKMGIEKNYESLLHGHVGYQQMESDVHGHIIKTRMKKPPVAGANLYLTLDNELQQVALSAFEGRIGALIALSPKTGNVLAMVSSPSFDANLFAEGITRKDYQSLRNSEKHPLYNRALRGIYPVASTIKPFLALFALELGLITSDTKIFDRGWYRLPNSTHIFHDYFHTGHGSVNLRRAIIVSCDTYFFRLGTIFGINRIADSLSKFGFGQPTRIDLQEELSGILPTPEWKEKTQHKSWYPGDTVNVMIGQGYVSTTMLQLANALATFANQGKWVQPHALLKYQLPNQPVIVPEFPQKQMIKMHLQHWQSVLSGMEGVIRDKEGTGRHQFGEPPLYEVAGKTGTGQVVSLSRYNPHAKVPSRFHDHSSFMAFAPTRDPAIVVAVVVEHDVIAPAIARKVIDFYMQQLQKKNPKNNLQKSKVDQALSKELQEKQENQEEGEEE